MTHAEEVMESLVTLRVGDLVSIDLHTRADGCERENARGTVTFVKQDGETIWVQVVGEGNFVKRRMDVRRIHD